MFEKQGFGRRIFLKASAAATLLMSIPGWVWAFTADSLYVRTVEKDTFRFDPATGIIKWKDKKDEPYKLIVGGLVESPASFSYSEIRAFTRATQVSSFHCVEGWDVYNLKWGGFRFSEITRRVKPHPDAKYVTFHSLGKTTSAPQGQDHYVESHPLEYLLDEGNSCMMSLTLNGEPLSQDHGSPLRLVAPFQLGYKNVKYIYAIQFEKERRSGWWTLANPVYSANAPVPGDRIGGK